MKPARIAILGANGQVGTELALLLSERRECEIRGVVRSPYGAALLRLAGISFASAGFEDAAALRAALHDCDLVVDLTYPGGQLTDIPRILSRNLAAILGAMRPGAGYVHMSSIMAFGSASHDSTLRAHRLPRVSYGRIKRMGEVEAQKLGSRFGIDTFILRLGQVHGHLQSVTQEYRRRTQRGHLCLGGEASALSTTLFTNAVADAVLQCARGAVPTDRVSTLVSNPQWSLLELAEAYRALYNESAQLGFEAPRAPARRLPSSLAASIAAGTPLRDLLEAYVLLKTPELFVRAKGRYRARASGSDAASSPAGAPDAAIPCLVGAVPGDLVSGLDSSPASSIRSQRALSARVDLLLERARK